MEQSKLFEEPEPELVSEGKPIAHPYKGTVIGQFARCQTRDIYIAVFNRNREEHFFRKYQGYGVSEEIIERLEASDINKLAIREQRSKSLLEYPLEAFRDKSDTVVYDTKKGFTVPKRMGDKGRRYDVQKIVAQEHAEIWKRNEYEADFSL